MPRQLNHTIITTIASALLILAGCIQNNIPYPRIQPNFTSFDVDGQDRGTTIDSATRTVTIYLPEQVNIADVSVHNYTINPTEATVVDTDLRAPLDLSRPLQVVLHLYQDYTWTIQAQQTITRYFTVAGQVGASTIDVANHRVIAYVAKNTPLTQITVETIKLGPDGSTIYPDIQGQTIDFSQPVKITVTAYGQPQTWTLYVQNSDIDVQTIRVDPWTNVAWVYAQAEAGKQNGIRYRLQGDTEWTNATADQLTIDGGNFFARLTNLQPLTTYEAQAYSDEATGQILTFTTQNALQVPNTNLDEWWLDGKLWCPWPQDGTPYWGTGNKGATTIGESNSIPTDDTSSGSGWAAMLQSKFIGIGPLGKFAAGNIFIGSYVRTDGTNGVLSFGRDFNLHPTKLTGHLKYTTAPINYTSAEFEYMKGQPDTCIVWIALIDTPQPFEIRTNPKNRNLFDPDADYVVAYGKVQYGQNVPSYIPFEITLDYKSTERTPTYLLITASSSKYGDYFTGGAGAVLCLDDLKLLYDY